MTRCLLALGANLGDRAATLRNAVGSIGALPKTQLLARSNWHATLPVGGPPGQEVFLNGAVSIETQLTPHELASSLQDIERQLGRERHVRWDARTIDIDLLLYGEQTIDDADLQIPHPRMSVRQFVLAPAAEIAGEMVHPPSGWTIAALLDHLRSVPRTVAVSAVDLETRKWLEQEINRELTTDPNLLATVKLISYDSPGGGSPTLAVFVGTAGSHPGPALHITAIDREDILQESLAAIRAAWPG